MGFVWLKAKRRLISQAFLCTERPWALRLTAADADDDDDRWSGNMEERMRGEKERDAFKSSQISLQYIFGLYLWWIPCLVDSTQHKGL